MAEQQNKQMSLEPDKLKKNDSEVDLIYIIHNIIEIRRTLYKSAGIGLIIGVIVALSIPRQYTVKVTLSPEVGSSKGSNGLAGLAASFLGNGSNMVESSDALNAYLSSDIVSSTPFLLELLETKVYISNTDTNTTLRVYMDEQTSPWWNYVLDLPSFIIGGVKSIFNDEDAVSNMLKQGTIELTKEENKKIDFLKKNIIASVDKKTAITTISVSLQEPRTTAIVADSVVKKLQEYIINYRTSKAKEDCIYLEKLFRERQQEYYFALEKYAQYVDTHDNLILNSVRTEQEKLQNDMSLAYQVYGQVANQLQVARAKVQEEKPVFAVVEPAVVPLQPSSMGIKIYGLLFMFLAVIFSMSWLLIGRGLWDKLRTEIKNK